MSDGRATGAPVEGEPIARGRSADIFDLGDGRVLRRCRGRPVADHEVAAMRLAERAGFPVPHVHTVDGTDMVLDRIDGRDMFAILGGRPWRAGRFGRLLGDLALQLRAIDIRDAEIRGVEPREAIVHGDLHPGNVLLTDDGPVVIDWEGAHLGAADSDAVTAWLLMAVSDIDGVPVVLRPFVRLVRARVRRAFLRRVGTPRRETIDAVCDFRLGDRNMRPRERDAIRAFRGEHGTGREQGACP